MDLGRLSAAAAVERLRAGTLTSVELVQACLADIEAREQVVGAWTWLDPAAALAAAEQADRRSRPGPLAGLPIAIKDVIDTVDMPTAYGSPIYAGNRPASDAACVARLRAAGAVILGKTVTTEFAYFTPGKTANPHNAGHTPGGSSSGSAAAVADGMVPAALGTQTAGSVIRPAAFCGVIGFKGSYGWTPMEGIKPFASSLDTLGLFAREVDDIELLRSVLAGEPFRPLEHDLSPTPRIGYCRTAHWSDAAAETRTALDSVARRLADAGAEVVELVLPVDGAQLTQAQITIMSAEAAQSYATEYRDHRNQLSPPLRTLVESGQALSPTAVAAARTLADRARGELAQIFGKLDAILTPAAPGEAPKGRERTGDPVFNRAWTLLGGPCLTVPIGRGPNGLPLGAQLVGAFGRDRRLLEIGAWAAARVGRQVPVCIL